MHHPCFHVYTLNTQTKALLSSYISNSACMRIINLFVFSDQQEVDSREQAQRVFVAFDTKKITKL